MDDWAAKLAEAIRANGGRPSGLMLAEVESLEPFKLKIDGQTVEKQIFAGQLFELRRGDLVVVWLEGGSFYILTKAVRIV